MLGRTIKKREKMKKSKEEGKLSFELYLCELLRLEGLKNDRKKRSHAEPPRYNYRFKLTPVVALLGRLIS